jgi:nitroreductase
MPKPVPKRILEEILALALQAPSNCNVQPWNVYVVSGQTCKNLGRELVAVAGSGQAPNPDFPWQGVYEGALRERQIGAAQALYGVLGIDRGDREARKQAMLKNFEFFGAPHAMFFVMEKSLQINGAVDLGIFAQTVALLMAERGIDSCLQGALGQFPDPVHACLGIPKSQGVLFGMSFGYSDDSHPANAARTVREPLDTLVRFVD